jgi:hypothetical protein
MTWVSEPDTGAASNNYFQAKLVPLKQGNNFFVTFRVEVKNLTQQDMSINWNKTYYMHNGKEYGIFVFKDITPEDVKNRNIPLDTIPPGANYTKVVAPFKLLSRAPLRVTGETGGIKGGILPEGKNAMRLVVEQGGREFTEMMEVIISEEMVP